jgi:hypothetical protein
MYLYSSATTLAMRACSSCTEARSPAAQAFSRRLAVAPAVPRRTSLVQQAVQWGERCAHRGSCTCCQQRRRPGPPARTTAPACGTFSGAALYTSSGAGQSGAARRGSVPRPCQSTWRRARGPCCCGRGARNAQSRTGCSLPHAQVSARPNRCVRPGCARAHTAELGADKGWDAALSGGEEALHGEGNSRPVPGVAVRRRMLQAWETLHAASVGNIHGRDVVEKEGQRRCAGDLRAPLHQVGNRDGLVEYGRHHGDLRVCEGERASEGEAGRGEPAGQRTAKALMLSACAASSCASTSDSEPTCTMT